MIHNPHLNYRPDIDGLRAIAVLLVLIFHGFPNFIKGGFVGVDIFFVISGYLITSIIFKAHLQGKFSLIDFYSRRIKRIFPALLVVLIFCLIFGWYSLLADEYQALGKHVVAGALYISNFVLQSEVGYFDTEADTKPLLHLWSLGIEEQFYLCFPLLIMLIYRFKKSPLLLISAGLLISFVLNFIWINNNPTAVFFYPQTRVWELLIGSGVAYINLYSRPRFDTFIAKLPFFKMQSHDNGSANLLAWLSLILIVLAWIFLDKRYITFPSGWALLPTLGAAGLILAGEKAWFNRKVLASKIAVWLGLISYPLYLWHWPLLALMRTIEMDKPKGFWRFLALVLSVFLAWLTYYFVEKRLRFRDNGAVTIGLLLSLMSVGFIGYQVNIHEGFPNRFHFENDWKEGELGAKTWMKRWIVQESCAEKYGSDLGFCIMKKTEDLPTVALVGDSHANHLYPGLLNHRLFKNENIIQIGQSSCPSFFDIPKKECLKVMNKSLELAIAMPSVHTIILNSVELNNGNFNELGKLLHKSSSEEINTFFQNSIRTTLQRLLKANKRVIFIIDIPRLKFNSTDCVKRPWRINKKTEKTPCAIPFLEAKAQRQHYQTLVNPVLKEFSDVNVWDPTAAFCDEKYCWAVKDKKMLYRDEHHLNEVGSIYLGNYLDIHYH